VPTKVLIADDEADLELLIRQRFQKQIRQNVYEFVFAQNGEEALQKLQEDAEISVVMTDLNMPVMDGLTLLSRIGSLSRTIKVVIVSAYGDMQNIRTAMNRGAYDFLTKPIDFEDFEVTMRKTMQEVTLLEEAQRAHRRWASIRQFFSPGLADELERNPALLEARDQDVTILMSDLRGFSSLSERLGAHQTCRLVRDMMERLSNRIVEYSGVIVDYVGDGILAMWNAPVSQESHALLACRAALAMLQEMPALAADWQEFVAGPLTLGIGVNTGVAQVGNTGSTRKFKYGPHGHTVNVASRVQDQSKRFGTPLLITAATRSHLPADLAVCRLGMARLAGIAGPVDLYELHPTPPAESWLIYREAYESALAMFEARRFVEAQQALVSLLETRRADDNVVPVKLLLERVSECLNQPRTTFDPALYSAAR
jgi:adenylate cyclase